MISTLLARKGWGSVAHEKAVVSLRLPITTTNSADASRSYEMDRFHTFDPKADSTPPALRQALESPNQNTFLSKIE